MRSFILKNELGFEWDLNDSDSFFHEVEGFGFEKKTTYELIGMRYIPVEDYSKQKAPKGKIRFSGYQKYEEFALFAQNSPFILKYTSNSEICINVNIDKLKKSEIEDGGLICDIEFASLSPYYIEVTQLLSPDGAVSVYPCPYDTSVYSDNASGTISIESNSKFDSPLKFTVIGPCTNPVWTHYVNSVVNTTGKVNCSIPAGHRLVVDASIIPYSIKEFDSMNNLITDQYQNSDFSTERFVMLKKGINKISFAHEGSEDLNVVAEGVIYYDTL